MQAELIAVSVKHFFPTIMLPAHADDILGQAWQACHFREERARARFSVLCAGEGLITYMRTDGLQMATSAISDIRQVVDRLHGSSYLPDSPRTYK